uniref:Tudor domain-containing protein n=1 Tax=Hyaloperonospora arabidopsidis (strain Emoy2) TaxID=559515 RepID=M4B2S0_HYAAE
MSADASLEKLEARLVTFTEQLQNIQELLQSDETNEEFLSIAKDLVEVIELTKETVRIEFEPDTAAEALQQGVWYPAHVDSVTSDGRYNVTFLGFGTSAALQRNELRAIYVDAEEAAQLPAKELITDGFKCRAKYYADAVVYSCSVTKVTPLGFQVLFDGYGNSEEVPYEYLRPAAESPQTVADTGAALTCTSDPGDGPAAALVPKVAPAVIHKPIKVPENLQILPSDTEAEKERKRKRLRAIKSLNRHKNIDNERNIKQHDWKAFQHKAKKKGIKKGVSGVLSKRGSSMFASPQTVEGRVGVMGSGQGMTNFPDARNKKPKHT